MSAAPNLETHAAERATPAFTRDFPDDPALAAIVDAFERGDYAFVRAEAPRLAAATKDDAIRAAALDLRRRIDPDPLATYLLLIAAALLAFLAFYYFGHKHVG